MAGPGQEDTAARRKRFEGTALGLMPSVYRVAIRLAGRPEDASDLTQETFLRAYRTFENFAPGTNCKAWLLTILYSVFTNRYRKSRREPELVPLETLEPRFHRAFSTDGREAEWSALRAANLDGRDPEVRKAIEELPESFRDAVLLVDVEELSYEEAAAVLRCPVGTLRSRLFRARKRLFLALRDYAQRAGYLKPTTTS